MQAKRISLNEEYGFGGYLDCMLLDYPFDIPMDWSRPAVIVVPGGGYGMTSKREGEIVAAEFFARGYQAFVLWYEVKDDGAYYPRQFLQLASAIDYVKRHAKEFSVKPDSVFAVGFSAGGHLVGSVATGYQDASAIAGKALDAAPTAVGLCYPVINYEIGHAETYENVIGPREGEEKARLIEKLSLDKAVTDKTPPAFIYTTAEDSVVDCRNSLVYAMALAAHKIPYELHVYPQGEHGASTGAVEITNEMPHYRRISAWIDDCVSFFNLFVK